MEAVGNGKQAFESAVRRPPALILTDAMMPLMEGASTTARESIRPHG